jgi:hypothetical protein
MRVRATATGGSQSNAIGQVELSCTPGGLTLGLYGVGAYSEGYATGALTNGTRFTVPYSGIRSVRVHGEFVQLELEAPGLPHDRLTLSRFTAGPGVPPLELRKRRLILQFTALSVAALATLAGTILAPVKESQLLAWGALGYGLAAGAIVLALGFSLHQSLFVRPPGEQIARESFLAELSIHYPAILYRDAPPPVKKRELPSLTSLLPRTAAAVGVTLAATILTALVTGQRMLLRQDSQPDRLARAERESPVDEVPVPTSPPPTAPPAELPADDELKQPAPTEKSGEVAQIERRCLCDRADSHLWKAPIPKLSGLLIEKRAIPLKNYTKTEAKIAVINNSDSPIGEITLHVQFYEPRGKKMVPTKERPLYYEGPLNPGEAVKWTTEARGTDFAIAVPDLGSLGPTGTGAASRDEFVKLLEANHRPVRLHAARMLSFLGDPRAREAALKLKDAMRAAEAPYLRRILAATGETLVCDVDVGESSADTVGACIYNATETPMEGLGVQLNTLSGALDVSQPLADPPAIIDQHKWNVPTKVPPGSGVYVRVPRPTSLSKADKGAVEVIVDRFDLLD